MPLLPSFLDQQYLAGFLINLARLCTWLVLLVAVFVPLERLFALHPKKAFRREMLADAGFFFISGLVPVILLAVPMSLLASGAHYLVPWRLQVAVAEMPFWLRAAAGLVVGEVGFYWGHRWTHEIPFLWRFHSVHHSPEHVYFLVSSHAHPFDNAFVRLCGLVPLYALGLANPVSVAGNTIPMLIIVVSTFWGFFIHANLRCRLGPLEWLITTPAFHHWHHTVDEHRDHNFAATLPWLDRLFGTHYLPRSWPPVYGINIKLPPSLGGQLVHPFRQPPRAAQSAVEKVSPGTGTGAVVNRL